MTLQGLVWSGLNREGGGERARALLIMSWRARFHISRWIDWIQLSCWVELSWVGSAFVGSGQNASTLLSVWQSTAAGVAALRGTGHSYMYIEKTHGKTVFLGSTAVKSLLSCVAGVLSWNSGRVAVVELLYSSEKLIWILSDIAAASFGCFRCQAGTSVAFDLCHGVGGGMGWSYDGKRVSHVWKQEHVQFEGWWNLEVIVFVVFFFRNLTYRARKIDQNFVFIWRGQKVLYIEKTTTKKNISIWRVFDWYQGRS